MIKAFFYRNQDFDVTGFSISGHAGFDDYGKDIVCAAVSAMTSLVVNTLEEIFHCGGAIEAEESGELSYSLPQSQFSDKSAYGVLNGFLLQLEDYAAQYPKNIKISLKDTK
ncbi:MAG: ribosomal-processing cysteine protease Prp [Ruminococcaceae bacterium]|nr:ribosomal-processing cysteine protease Prp [Oscillospiraceae bacterium]